jgi:hypothetical protein
MIGCMGAVSYATTKECVRGKGYLLEFVSQGVPQEARNPHWFRLEQLADNRVPEEARFLLSVAEMRRVALAKTNP